MFSDAATVSEARNADLSRSAQARTIEFQPVRRPLPWGKGLNESDYAALEKSWITREIADAAMLRRVDEYEGREIVGQKGRRDCAGIVIPYYWPGTPDPFNYRLRRDNPDWRAGQDGKPKPDGKYLSAPNGSNRLFIPPGVTLEQLQEASLPIALVEGEKKALALSRLAKHETETPRFIPIAIARVWSWRGRIGKTGGPNGERLDIKGPISDLSRIAWNERRVFIVFDTNVHTNESVKWARSGIARELASRGAKVHLINMPEDCGVNGIDDLLACWGSARVLELFDASVCGAQLSVVMPPQFQSKSEGLFRITSRGELLTQIQLTNYQAVITANISLDDGVETKREFEMNAELTARKYQFTIAASEFARMDWPIEQMGATAITYPNQRDYARTAIQSLSVCAADRRLFTHTGWRNLDGGWVFLHADGAIDASGVARHLDVRLSTHMSRYVLRISNGPEELAWAIRASLRLVELGPPSISFPLLAATCRAILGGADFAIHLAGETGAFKSELAALHQQHFGAAMNRLNLPGAWSSTGNALEALAFYAKDALVVIDDFAPQGNSPEIARYHAAADRVFRAAGNQAGRSRLDSNAKLRETKAPRALILSTGEDIPRGQSIRARLLILELSKGAIKPADLSECQKDAEEGAYAQAFGGFVQWLAGRYEDAREAFARKVSEYRTASLANLTHARTPDIVANLQAAFDMYLEFAGSSEALNGAERHRLAMRCRNALCQSGTAQAKYQTATEPTSRFLSLLTAALFSGTAHLAERDWEKPTRSPGACGWRRENSGRWEPNGECIGWVDDECLYLEPTAAYRVAQKMGRDTEEPLPISEQTLRRRLRDKGLLASTDRARQTLTVRRTIGGASTDVLYLRRTSLIGEDLEPADEEEFTL